MQRKIFFILLVYFISLQSNSDFFSINIAKVLIKVMESLKFKSEKGVQGIFAQMEKTHRFSELSNGLLKQMKSFFSLLMLGYMSSNR